MRAQVRPERLQTIGGRALARSRTLVGTLTVTALVLAAVALSFVDAPGSVASDDLAVPAALPESPSALAAASDEDAEDVEAQPITTPVLRTVEVVVSRDPFDPVRPEEDKGETATGNGNGTDPTTPPANGTGAPPPAGNGTGAPPPTGNGTSADRCVEQGELVCDGQVVTVPSTTPSSATVIIGEATYPDVSVGATFAANVTLTAIDESGCAILRFGAQLVRVCPGTAGTLK